MKEREMKLIGNWIADVIEVIAGEQLPDDKAKRKPYLEEFKKRAHSNKKLARMRKEVRLLCRKFPIPESHV